ncbi:MAG TPA: radical SAM protein [Polyangiaceae bacterium]|nr:radical SAM protein [Polyangiaceae bacterium]
MPYARSPLHPLARAPFALCNSDCKYCHFSSKERLYPGSTFRPSDDLLENYLQQYLESQPGPEIDVAWRDGEPTLLGLDFFRKSIELERKYRRPGTVISNTIQTNGTLLDDGWCAFFRDNEFLVSLSLDGPKELHDLYRVDERGLPTFDRAMRGLRCLQKHGVPVKVLTTVHAVNGDYPVEVYRFLRDEAGAEFIQLIPVVERLSSTGCFGGDTVSDRSVGAEQFGRFLIAVFDEWVRRDVGKVFVQTFDGALGDVARSPVVDLAASERRRSFGRAKLETLPRCCRDCSVLFACNGGCSKDRFVRTPEGEPNLNYLCAGYKAFFEHVARPMRRMAALLRAGRPPSDLMREYVQRAPAQNFVGADESAGAPQ